MVISDWKLEVERDGFVYVVYQNERNVPVKRYLTSDEITFTEDGFKFVYQRKNEVMSHEVYCMFKKMYLDKRLPLPVYKRQELGTFDDAAVKKLRSQMLGFVYEFIAGLRFEHCPVIVKKPPFDVEALLAEYSKFSDQLSIVDWHKVEAGFLERGLVYEK